MSFILCNFLHLLIYSYNINAGTGTDFQAFSVGDGLLEHERAYLLWLEDILKQYSQLVIENCSSGGMRMAYSLLQLRSIQSVSDQIDYQKMAVIASAAPAAVTPEQAAIWSYPTEHSDMEKMVCNMVNAMLLRIHQSGHLGHLEETQFKMVKKGISIYKKIRKDIAVGIPFWSLGMSVFEDEWAVLGLEIPGNSPAAYLAVWHLKSGSGIKCIPLKKWKEKNLDIVCLYPDKLYCEYKWSPLSGCLGVELPNRASARLFQIKESKFS